MAGLLAAAIGSLSLRTGGVYFMMITLALVQMLFYLTSSLQAYGGDDGLCVARNTFAGLVDLRQQLVLYYLVFTLLCLVLWLGRRLVQSRFGLLLRGIQANERRMQALGYATFTSKLVGFTVAGAVAGLAGALLANHTAYVSPALLHWTRSGEIMVMVLLGGLGSGFGPVLGAVVLLLTEELVSSYTEHWRLILRPLLLLIVLSTKRGL